MKALHLLDFLVDFQKVRLRLDVYPPPVSYPVDQRCALFEPSGSLQHLQYVLAHFPIRCRIDQLAKE